MDDDEECEGSGSSLTAPDAASLHPHSVSNYVPHSSLMTEAVLCNSFAASGESAFLFGV
jgi:hypothetical protein